MIIIGIFSRRFYHHSFYYKGKTSIFEKIKFHVRCLIANIVNQSTEYYSEHWVIHD